MIAMRHATDDSFDRLLAKEAVIAVFHTRWDKFTRRNRPALERVAAERGIGLVMVNIERCPSVAARLGIKGIPHFHLYRDGKLVAQRMGGFTISEKRNKAERDAADLAYGMESINRWLDTQSE